MPADALLAGDSQVYPLELRGVSVSFGGVRALSDFSLQIPAGAITAVIGPNGAGKTTMFNVASRLVAYQQGRVFLGGRDLASVRRADLVRLGLARTYQNIALFPGLSVLDNVVVGAYARQGGSLPGVLLRSPRARREERDARDGCLDLLGRLGLGEVASRAVRGLPYGVMKRVELARALAARPRLLMLDEPAAGLSSGEVDELIELLRSVHRDDCPTMVIVEHHMRLVMQLSHAVTVLNFGRVLASGTPEQVAANQSVIDAYLGVPA
jgi:branched-chain amino acid transport system ATP-binding protein